MARKLHSRLANDRPGLQLHCVIGSETNHSVWPASLMLKRASPVMELRDQIANGQGPGIPPHHSCRSVAARRLELPFHGNQGLPIQAQQPLCQLLHIDRHRLPSGWHIPQGKGGHSYIWLEAK